MKIIDGNRTVYELIKENLGLKEILVRSGLTPLKDDKMLQTIGRMISLNDGIKQTAIDKEQLAEELLKANYQLKE